MESTSTTTLNKVPEVEVEVQIMDLKDVYDKKTKKTFEGLKYRLDDSEVTVVLQASETITSVRAYTQRCPEAAMRTNDTIGMLRNFFSLLKRDLLTLNFANRILLPAVITY